MYNRVDIVKIGGYNIEDKVEISMYVCIAGKEEFKYDKECNHREDCLDTCHERSP